MRLLCGFSLGNDIPRKTLSTAEILREAGVLKSFGFEHVLLVTGESSMRVGVDYLADALRTLRRHFANLSIEAQPLHVSEYERLIEEGLHAVMVYQETYERGKCAPSSQGKKNFEWRLETPDRLGQAGVNKIGLVACSTDERLANRCVFCGFALGLFGKEILEDDIFDVFSPHSSL